MTINPEIALRLQFLVRVVHKECQHLVATGQRLLASHSPWNAPVTPVIRAKRAIQCFD